MRSRISTLCLLATAISGCATAPHEAQTSPPLAAACQRLDPLATDHAAGLVTDGGPISKTTGGRLIAAVDASCAVVK